MSSFFLLDYSICKEDPNVDIILGNNKRRRIYGNQFKSEGSWFGDKISFTEDYCYFVWKSCLYRCEIDNLPYGLYPSENLIESENGYYNIVTKWENE